MLDFKAISEAVPFFKVLDYLGVAYEESEKELRFKLGSDVCIANKGKNLFLCPTDKDLRGGVINLVAIKSNMDVKKAAVLLQSTFLDNKKPLEREIPELKLHYSPIIERMGISIETCQALELGLVKERSVMSGKIAFNIKDSEGNKVGYVGWNEKQGWYFPKGHRNIFVYNLHNCHDPEVTLVSDTFEVARLHQQGIPAITLMSASSHMTEEQEKTLKSRFSSILVKVPHPLNIVSRLVDSCYVKTA